VLGQLLRRHGILDELAAGCTIHQKTIRYTPAEKLTMLFAGLLTGITSIDRMDTLRSDRALLTAFGLPGCAEQSVLSDTLSAATDADVAHLRTATEMLLRRYGRALHHDFAASILTLDLDLSPAPASKRCEGSVKSYQGKAQSHYGRKFIRVISRVRYGEVLWEDMIEGNRTECLALVKDAVTAIEQLFGIADTGRGDDTKTSRAAAAIRGRIEWRLDSGWGNDDVITYLLTRGYHVTGKFHTHTRVKRLAKLATEWKPALHPGGECAVVGTPVAFERPVYQLLVRVPSTRGTDGYGYTVFFSSRTEFTGTELIAHYDCRAGIEADLKSDKRGIGMATIRKHQLAAQRVILLLIDLVHNILTWAREWLATYCPRLAGFGIVRLIRDIWGIPGRVKITGHTITHISLRKGYPHTNELAALVATLLQDEHPAFLGQT
jgi:hypothetical protein